MRTIKITTTNKAAKTIADKLLSDHIPHRLTITETETVQVQHVVPPQNYPGLRVLIGDYDEVIAVYHLDSQANIERLIADGEFAMDALYTTYDGNSYIGGINIITGTPIMAMINDL